VFGMTKRYLLPGLWVLLLLSRPVGAEAQTDPRAVLDNAIQRLGGENYLNATDMTVTGRFFQFQRGQLVGGEVFIDYVQFPDKERTEFGEDRDVVRINNGVQGWNVNDGDVEEQLPEQIDVFWEEFKVSLDYLLRFGVNDSQTTLQYLGRNMIDFKRADILELRDDDRTRITLYIERETGLMLKKSVRRLDDPAVHEEVYSNFHELQNVLTPLLVHRYTDGLKTMEIHLEEVTYNNAFSDELFVAPVRK
jgi:hypothetical protein